MLSSWATIMTIPPHPELILQEQRLQRSIMLSLDYETKKCDHGGARIIGSAKIECD